MMTLTLRKTTATLPRFDSYSAEQETNLAFPPVDDVTRVVPAIEFRNVHLAFDDKKILNDISFKVYRGEKAIILGGSGTGKSTIVKLALGLLKPDAGQIFIDGEDITHYSEQRLLRVRDKIGMVFQEGALFDSLSVYDNVAFRLHERGIAENMVEAEVQRMLCFVNLEDAIDKMPGELSGGMRRRVGIARALVGNPSIILYDEPTAGLDPLTSVSICKLAIRLRDLEDVSSLFVTHRLHVVESLCSEYAFVNQNGEFVFEHEGEKLCLNNTKILMLNEGKIIFRGSEEELEEVNDPHIKKFLNGR